MSSTIEEGLTHRDSLLEVEHDVERREAERRDLAREIAAQHERLHTLRATVLEELTKQRRVTMPRWPAGRRSSRRTSTRTTGGTRCSGGRRRRSSSPRPAVGELRTEAASTGGGAAGVQLKVWGLPRRAH